MTTPDSHQAQGVAGSPASPAPAPSHPRSAGPEGEPPVRVHRAKETDLGVRTFPLVSAEEWRAPEEVLRRMYLDVEERAIEAYGWYMRDRIRKKTVSRRLRGAAIVLAAAGGLQPLASAAGSWGGMGWGYVLLASAGVCVAFDHFLGLSSGWMRDMVSAHTIRQRLHEFQLDWAGLGARDALAGQETPVQEYLELVRAFIVDLSEIVNNETTEWATEFKEGLSQFSLPSGPK
ncbi:SLATT domain-containing protein [Streptosporangium sp. NPDC051023]|uniref:SLATT domain-containing protein n=1 Tax=Streptosporangium sp. NPDC051023 TaxID=3155410 RepID=UPI00344F48B2